MNDIVKERWELVYQRIREIPGEKAVPELYQDYFDSCACFLYQTGRIALEEEPGKGLSPELLQKRCDSLYRDILPEQYGRSYGNPIWAAQCFGGEMGQMLCFLYAQLRGAVPLAYEKRQEELTALFELFVEIYTDFTDEETPSPENIRQVLYWYCFDYCGDMVARRVREQVDPSLTFAADIIMNSDLTDLSYLYRYGEYITENEIRTAEHLNAMCEGQIEDMARTYTEGYREGFIHAGIDLSKKRTVNIRYAIGFERMIRAAVRQFAAMGLEPTIFRSAVHAVSKSQNGRIGYVGTQANPQYDYDHRMDDALFLDEDFAGRKLRVTTEAYEQMKELARGHAGPACLETFGEKAFVPEQKKECLQYTAAQRKLSARCRNELGQITNRYIPGDERSFTIIAYPVQEIGSRYEEIFAETLLVNNLDSRLYQQIQQSMIDCLDQGVAVAVKGANGNRTDLRVALQPLSNPAKETIFENCVADVNIPVGEVFTSPMLAGTNGLLHVKRVYLNGLPYENLELSFAEGRIISYTCTNFDAEEENLAYVKENVLFNHDTLPLGEFAIGTNTTAYRMGRRYHIEGKLPILIAEKTGPHFAVGDTCYSWAEDVKVYNPDGKEIIARDNEMSLLRKEDPSKAYVNCHTDITIPYDELGCLAVILPDGSETVIIRDGRFVLPGTEGLNTALEELDMA